MVKTQFLQKQTIGSPHKCSPVNINGAPRNLKCLNNDLETSKNTTLLRYFKKLSSQPRSYNSVTLVYLWYQLWYKNGMKY